MTLIPKRRMRGSYADRVCCSRRGYMYCWEIIKGPDYLLGHLLREMDLTYGGWCNGEIHARNIRDGKILIKRDSVEAVI